MVSGLSCMVSANDSCNEFNDKETTISVDDSSMVEKSPYLIGHITKQQTKDFIAGLTIGVAHGSVNHLVKYIYKLHKQEVSFFAIVATYFAACKLQAAYGGNDNDEENPELLWGHGIGQFFTETFDVEPGLNKSLELKPTLNFNMSLFKAIFLI